MVATAEALRGMGLRVPSLGEGPRRAEQRLRPLPLPQGTFLDNLYKVNPYTGESEQISEREIPPDVDLGVLRPYFQDIYQVSREASKHFWHPVQPAAFERRRDRFGNRYGNVGGDDSHLAIPGGVEAGMNFARDPLNGRIYPSERIIVGDHEGNPMIAKELYSLVAQGKDPTITLHSHPEWFLPNISWIDWPIMHQKRRNRPVVEGMGILGVYLQVLGIRVKESKPLLEDYELQEYFDTWKDAFIQAERYGPEAHDELAIAQAEDAKFVLLSSDNMGDFHRITPAKLIPMLRDYYTQYHDAA